MATRPWTCRKCLRKLSLPYIPTRSVADRYLQHQIAAQWEWKDKAAEIEKGMRKSMLATLEERGFIHQIAGYAYILSILFSANGSFKTGVATSSITSLIKSASVHMSA
jgi:hypothetical protein